MGGRIDKVISGLYVGGLLGSEGKEKLKEANMTHILSVHDRAEPEYPDDFVYKCVNVDDISSADLSAHFEECLEFIHQCRLGGGSVYVHCAAGISRSVTIVVMYLMTVSKMNFAESLTIVKYCRQEASPNYGFRQQLRKYENERLAEERARVLSKYPHTEKMEDMKYLKELLVKAKEKFGKVWEPLPQHSHMEEDFRQLWD